MSARSWGMATAANVQGNADLEYHGDVLNTAARLEKKCNEYDENFITSQHIIDKVGMNHKYKFKLLSDMPLRGKTESLKIYSVSI